MWLAHADFGILVVENWALGGDLEGTIRSFVMTAKKWNTEEFGNIFVKKKVLIAKISGIQKCIDN